MSLKPGTVEVLYGFEPGVAATQRILRQGRHVAILTSATAAEEFVPGLLAEARAFIASGGKLRLLLLGRPSADLAGALAEAGVALRLLEEDREFGFLGSEQEALLWPLQQPRNSVLVEVTLHVRDAPFLAHLLLAFERVWEQGQPFR